MKITRKWFASSSSHPSVEAVMKALQTLGVAFTPPTTASCSGAAPSSEGRDAPSSVVSDVSIKRAFQEMIKQHHPDVVKTVPVSTATVKKEAERESCSHGVCHPRCTSAPLHSLPSSTPFSSSSSFPSSWTPSAAAPPPPSIQNIVEAYQLLRRLTPAERQCILDGRFHAGANPTTLKYSCSSSVYHSQPTLGYSPEEYEKAMKIYRGFPRAKRPEHLRKTSSSSDSTSTSSTSKTTIFRDDGKRRLQVGGSVHLGKEEKLNRSNGSKRIPSGVDGRTAAFNRRENRSGPSSFSYFSPFLLAEKMNVEGGEGGWGWKEKETRRGQRPWSCSPERREVVGRPGLSSVAQTFKDASSPPWATTTTATMALFITLLLTLFFKNIIEGGKQKNGSSARMRNEEEKRNGRSEL